MRYFFRTVGALLAGAVAAFASAPVSADYLSGAQFYLNKEYKSAYGQLLPAAESGHALAQFMVAVMYDVGNYVQRDGKVAAEWYRKAAEQGHPDAQFFLAGMLYKGIDVPQDREAAYMWGRLAFERLHGEKQEKVATFTASVATLLSKEQLARTQAAAAAWHPRMTTADARVDDTQRLLRTGTGFFLNASGTLLTNQHVVYACQRIIVSYGDKTVKGTLLDVDFGDDLATVQTDIKPSGFARFSGEPRPKQGALVSVTGYAVQHTNSRDALTSSGNVLNAGMALDNAAWLQTSVPIYRGQSGSPALDSTGWVIGVARGVFRNQPDGISPVDNDGQATVVGADSVARFLDRTKTLFAKISDRDASNAKPTSPSDFIVLLECWGS